MGEGRRRVVDILAVFCVKDEGYEVREERRREQLMGRVRR